MLVTWLSPILIPTRDWVSIHIRCELGQNLLEKHTRLFCHGTMRVRFLVLTVVRDCRWGEGGLFGCGVTVHKEMIECLGGGRRLFLDK